MLRVRTTAIVAAAASLLAVETAWAFAPQSVISRPSLRPTTSQLGASKEEEKPSNEPRHEVRSSGPMPDLSEEEQQRLQEQAQQYMEYQQAAPKLDWPTEGIATIDVLVPRMEYQSA